MFLKPKFTDELKTKIVLGVLGGEFAGLAQNLQILISFYGKQVLLKLVEFIL